MPSLTLNPNPHHGTAKKIIHLTKSKTIAASSNAFGAPPPSLKTRNRRICRAETPSESPSDSDRELTVPLIGKPTDETRFKLPVLYWLFLKTTVEKKRNFLRTFCSWYLNFPLYNCFYINILMANTDFQIMGHAVSHKRIILHVFFLPTGPCLCQNCPYINQIALLFLVFANYIAV